MQVFLGHEEVSGGTVADATVNFDLYSIGSSQNLANTNAISKIDVNFTKVLTANASGNKITDLFIIGLKNSTSTESGGGSGLGNYDTSLPYITGAFVADIKVVVTPKYN